MADGASKLDKLARLKTLKSGLKPKGRSIVDDEENLTLDSLLEEPEAGDSDPAVQHDQTAQAVALEKPSELAPKKDKPEPEAESLSAYFEALGIVPDSAKVAGATGTAPKPYTPNPLTDPAPKKPIPPVKGREIDARDRWADPVREDNTVLSSFAGETLEKDDPLPLVSFTPDFDAAAADNVVSNDHKTPEEALPEIEAIAGVEELPESQEPENSFDIADDILSLDDPVDALDGADADVNDDESEEFGGEIDIEAFEREIALAEEARAKPRNTDSSQTKEKPDHVPEAATSSASGKPPTVTFDENRAALLEQVSKQMQCSIDDVVVTAVDWYLDALLGEENADREAGAAE